MANTAAERKPEKIQIGKSQFWLFTYSIGFFRANSSQVVGPWDFYEVKLHFESPSFSNDYGRTSRLSSFYYISNHENFIPKYLEKAFIGFAQTSRTLGQVWRNKLPWSIMKKGDFHCREIGLQVKWKVTSFRCFDNSVVNITLLITNFHLFFW